MNDHLILKNGKMAKVLGLGIDLLRISRIASLVERDGINSATTNRFAQRVLHERELTVFKEYQHIQDTDGIVNLLSGAWCLKEAIFKSLPHVDQKHFKMRQWYKLHSEEGMPFINSDYIDKNPNEEFLVSISHDSDLIISTVLRQLK